MRRRQEVTVSHQSLSLHRAVTILYFYTFQLRLLMHNEFIMLPLLYLFYLLFTKQLEKPDAASIINLSLYLL